MTIIVPYRDRAEHLAQFISHMRKHLPSAKLLVVEQEEGKPFNRGKLLNIGYLETKPSLFIAHDVDMLPLRWFYQNGAGVTQLARSDIQKNDYLGGVTMYDGLTFCLSGGYHNDYFHRAEDNEMAFNLKRLGIAVYKFRTGPFNILPHPRTGPEFIPELWEKAQQPRTVQNQLAVCEYEVLKREQRDGYEWLLVSI